MTLKQLRQYISICIHIGITNPKSRDIKAVMV